MSILHGNVGESEPMVYKTSDYLQELRRMARGKKTKIPEREVAQWAVSLVKYGLANLNRNIAILDQHYRLPDTR